MFGKGDKPDVDYVNDYFGCKKGEELPSGGVSNFLLSEGFYVHSIGTFDPVRFIVEGISYLKERTPEWTKAHQKFWTPERLDERQANAIHAIEFRQQFPRYQSETRPPTFEDILSFLANGKVVDAEYSYGKNELSVGVGLLYGVDGQHLKVYDPGEVEWVVTKPWEINDFCQRWTSTSISVYWKP